MVVELTGRNSHKGGQTDRPFVIRGLFNIRF